MTHAEKIFSSFQWPDLVPMKSVGEALHFFCTDLQWSIQRTDRKQIWVLGITCPILLLTKVMSNNIQDLKCLAFLFNSSLAES